MVDVVTSVLSGTVTFFVPGLALALPLLIRRPGWAIHEVLIVAGALSLALNALALMALTTFGVPLTPASLAATYGLIVGLGSVWLFVLHKKRRLELRPFLAHHWSWGVGLLGLFVAVVFLRWLLLAPLPVPPGADVVHHVAIVDLILSQGAVPSTYLPYWNVPEYSYHFGFHANAAAFALISGNTPLEAVTVLGPVLMGLASLAMYLFVSRLTGSRWAGFIAALVTGFLSVFPAFYLIWGRLAQLTGLVLVLVTLVLLLEILAAKPSVPLLLVGGAMLAAVFLTHYRMLFFLLFGLIAIVLARIVREGSLRTGWRSLVRIAPMAGVALLLASPWIVTLFQSALAANILSTPLLAPELFNLLRVSRPLAFPSSAWLLGATILGVILTSLRRQFEFVLLVAWAGLAWFFSTPFHVPLWFFGLLDTGTLISVAFVFQAAFVGIGLLVVLDGLRGRKPWRHVAFALASGGIVAAGLLGTVVIPLEDDNLMKPADQRAFSWIEANIPPDSLFATNVGIDPFVGIVVPLDAGVWITYFTGRAQLAPGLAPSGDIRPDSEYFAILQALPGVEAKVGSFDSFLYLRQIGVTHLYLGARDSGPMDASEVETSQWYTVIYREDDVTIAAMVDLASLTPLTLSGGRDWSSVLNGYAVAREWEGNGPVLESYTFQGFRADYSLPMDDPGRYRISVRLHDFVANDWVTGQPLSALRFELDGEVLFDHEYGTDTVLQLTTEVTRADPGIHTLTVRNRDSGLPFRLSLGSIVVEYLGPA